MSELRLVFPMPPNIANSRMHWRVKHRAKCGYWALVDLMHGHGYDHATLCDLDKLTTRTKNATLRREMEQARDFAAGYVGEHAASILKDELPAPPRWAHATIRSTMHLGARMDTGNAMNRHKWVEDWLVTRGYLADDSEGVLRWTGFPEQIVKRDGNYRLEITLAAA